MSEHVIIVTVDGLSSKVIQDFDQTLLPGFNRLLSESAHTLNARIDPDISTTLPSHVSILTGRFYLGAEGHTWDSNSSTPLYATIHDNKGDYLTSLFDVAHDAGLRTGLFASKSKFHIFDDSYNETTGAVDTTGADNGRDKIDVYHVESTTSMLFDRFRQESQTDPFDLALIHMLEPDQAGHAGGWGPLRQYSYSYAIRFIDRMITNLLDYVESDPSYAGTTSIILTSDHGGQSTSHTDPTSQNVYTVPFAVWGPAAEQGADLYGINPGRTDPGATYVPRADMGTVPPVLHAEAANLSLAMLGLSSIPGSTVNAHQDLRISQSTAPTAPVAEFTVTPSGDSPLRVDFDGSASTDSDGSIQSFVWDLGDGTSASGIQGSHTYDAAGSYTITLTVTDDDGLTNQSTQTVSVSETNPQEITRQYQRGVHPTSSYAAVADTKILSDAAITTYGSDARLEMDGYPSYKSLLKWDLSDIPVDAKVLDASVTFEVTNKSTDTYALYEILTPWTEGGATWMEASSGTAWTSPGLSAPEDRAFEKMGSLNPGALGSHTVSLTASGLLTLQQWIVAPSTNNGFLIENESGGWDGVDIASSEASDPAARPLLAVTYTTDPNQNVNLPPEPSFAVTPAQPTAGEPVTFDASESRDVDGTIQAYEWSFGDGSVGTGQQMTHTYAGAGRYTVSLTITDDDGASVTTEQTLVVESESIAEIGFQDGIAPTASYTGTRDTKIKSDAPSITHGAATNLETDGQPDYAILLRWDIEGIPQGSTILSASILVDVTNPTGSTYEIHELKRAWSESNATWTQADVSEPWTAAGAGSTGDREPVVVGRVSTAFTGHRAITLNEDGINMVERWIADPSTNHGIIFQDYENASDGLDFFSREALTPSSRPRLDIKYTTSQTSAAAPIIRSDQGHSVRLRTNASGSEKSLIERFADSALDGASPVVSSGGAISDEYHLTLERTTSVLLMVPGNDTSRALSAATGFMYDQTTRLGSTTYQVYRRSFAPGDHSIDVPPGAHIFVRNAAKSPLSVRADSLPDDAADEEAGLSVYPNPFDNAVEIELTGYRQGRLELVDMLGRRAKSRVIYQGRTSVSTDGLSTGTYIVRFESDTGTRESVIVTKSR